MSIDILGRAQAEKQARNAEVLYDRRIHDCEDRNPKKPIRSELHFPNFVDLSDRSANARSCCLHKVNTSSILIRMLQ